MAYKFSVGQAVEYRPTGAKIAVFTVIRQMPEEFQAIDRKYRIKSEHENFERSVLECDLSAADRTERRVCSARSASTYGGH